jgi:hypothetical protein
MQGIRGVGVLLSLVALGAAPAAGQPPRSASAQSAAEVMAQAAVAMGGAQALAAIKDLTVRGSVTLSGPAGELQGESVGEILYPDSMRSTVTLPMGAMVQGFDGSSGWSSMGGQTADMPGSLVTELRRGIATAAGLGVVRDAIEGRATVELQPGDSVRGRPCDVVRWSKDDVAVTLYYDAQTHLLVKVAYRAATPQGETDLEIQLFNHKVVDGVKVPFGVVGLQGGQRYLDLTVREVRFNTGLEPERFAKPK